MAIFDTVKVGIDPKGRLLYYALDRRLLRLGRRNSSCLVDTARDIVGLHPSKISI